MDAQSFTNLYTRKSEDETLTPFGGDLGFSLIKHYPEQSPYNRDGKRMFIKKAISDDKLFYSVNMTQPKTRNGQEEFILTDGNEYKKKVTNYYSGGDEFNFNFDQKTIVHLKTGKEFDMNQFLRILVNNHMSDRLFWQRKLNWCVNVLLKFLFWLADKHYERVKTSLDKYHFSRGGKPETEEEKTIEPFFKYFYISKNLIFIVLLISFILAITTSIFPESVPLKDTWHYLFGEFSLSNPMVVLFFFLALFTSEKLSVWLNSSIKNFFEPQKDYFHELKPTLIEKLHNFQYKSNFKLKLDLRS